MSSAKTTPFSKFKPASLALCEVLLFVCDIHGARGGTTNRERKRGEGEGGQRTTYVVYIYIYMLCVHVMRGHIGWTQPSTVVCAIVYICILFVYCMSTFLRIWHLRSEVLYVCTMCPLTTVNSHAILSVAYRCTRR